MTDDTDTSTDLAKIDSLTGLITKAAAALASATTYAEILEASDRANVAYVEAKLAERLAKARDAHNEIITACHKVQADALVIEAQAQCRLAEEYDAAQERGEVSGSEFKGNQWSVPNENAPRPSAADIGLTRKRVHEARQVRDAERKNPGIVRKTLSEKLDKGEAPTRADVKRAIAPKRTVAPPPSYTFAPAAPPKHEPEPEPAADDDKPWCRFCGKTSSEVTVLICARQDEDDPYIPYICDECVDMCVEIIEERNGPTETNIGEGISVSVENDAVKVSLTRKDGSGHIAILDAAALRTMVEHLERGEEVVTSSKEIKSSVKSGGKT